MATIFCLLLCLATFVAAQIDPRLKIALALNTTSSGVSTTPDGRLFILWNHIDGTTGPWISEYIHNGTLDPSSPSNSSGTFIPYPDLSWNTPSNTSTKTHFISPAAQRIGPDGALWILDNGGLATPWSSKLISINLTTNTVSRTYSLRPMTLPTTHWDDVRFSWPLAYLSDPGSNSLGVLDLHTSAQRLLLTGSRATTSPFPASAEGRFMTTAATGAPLYFGLDQIEVSPDGRWLYLHPLSGGFWKIRTAALDAALGNETLAGELDGQVRPWAAVGTTGGTAIDARGSVWSGQTDENGLVRTDRGGRSEVVLRDERLLWVDAMWVDARGWLWMPVNQLFRSTITRNVSEIVKPLYVFVLDIGVGPSPRDHA